VSNIFATPMTAAPTAPPGAQTKTTALAAQTRTALAQTRTTAVPAQAMTPPPPTGQGQ